MTRCNVRGFGLNWQADLPLDQFDTCPAAAMPQITVKRVGALDDRAEPRPVNRGAIYPDGFRFRWLDEAAFDFFTPGRIDYAPGKDWRGEMPAAFYSTVTSLALAWLGRIALHASAVEWEGKALLIAGKAGAGKSTMLAELLAGGGRLISDDLTALGQTSEGRPSVWRGRKAMRLHPDTVQSIACARTEHVADDPRGKLLAWPVARTAHDELPVAGLLVLGEDEGRIPPVALAPILPTLLFRPRWMAKVPGHAERRKFLLEMAQAIPAQYFPRVDGFTPDDRANRLERLRKTIAAFG